MTQKDFWRKSNVAIIGGGSWGTVLANIVARNCENVHVWVRGEEHARSINVTRSNPHYLPEFQLSDKVHAYSQVERVFESQPEAVIWALPSSVYREQTRALAHLFKGHEVVLHATKGIEEGSLKRISEILHEELPCRRIGVISGPNLAHEVARGEPASTVVASDFDEVVQAGRAILSTPYFGVYGGRDVVGVEWAGTLKNVLAIAAGAVDALKLGWNARAMLITSGLSEMVRFGVTQGAKPETFMGLAGIGDLMATCSSPLSRNYRVGMRLAQDQSLAQVLEELGTTVEGVRTAKSVWKYAQDHQISMPLTQAVNELLDGTLKATDILKTLIARLSST